MLRFLVNSRRNCCQHNLYCHARPTHSFPYLSHHTPPAKSDRDHFAHSASTNLQDIEVQKYASFHSCSVWNLTYQPSSSIPFPSLTSLPHYTDSNSHTHHIFRIYSSTTYKTTLPLSRLSSKTKPKWRVFENCGLKWPSFEAQSEIEKFAFSPGFTR